MPNVNWGDIPTWISAIAAIGALVAAVVAGRIARRLFLIETARDRDEMEARKKLQAGQIAAWAQWGKAQDRGAQDLPAIVFRNASQLPVYDLQLDLIHNNQILSSERHSVLPPSDRQIESPQVIPTVRRSQLLEAQGQPLQVRFRYRDSSGVVWMREVDGTLFEVVSSPTSLEQRAKAGHTQPAMLENKPGLVMPEMEHRQPAPSDLRKRD